MDAKQFLAEFGHIAGAPAGVQRLREMILQLAVSGKLVESAISDASVDEVIAGATILKANYVKKLKLRTSKQVSPVLNEEVPYEIPVHWSWQRLDKISSYIQRGRSPKYSTNGQTYVISQKCVQWVGFNLLAARKITQESLEKYGSERFLMKNDLLWNSTGTGTVGRVSIYDHNEVSAVADSHVTVVRLTNFNARYIWCVIASPFVQNRFLPEHPAALVSGSTKQVELNTSSVKNLLIPCPPLEEQSRIVAKVDELMALCDKLEAQQQEKRKLQNHLRQSTLAAVASAESPEALRESWKRLEGSFSHLFAEAEDVEEFKLLVKDLAIRGLLTKRVTDAEPAYKLLERIAERQTQGLKSRRRRQLDSVDLTQAPFQLPEGWSWARFPELGVFERGKSKHRPRNDPKLFNPGIYPFIQTGEVARANRYITHFKSKYSQVGLEQSKLWPQDTLCITIAANIAESSILKFEACFPDSVVGFIPDVEISNSLEYFLAFMDTAKSKLLEFAPSTAQKNINLKILESVLVPIPPVTEMVRIVQIIESVSKLCDDLESNLLSERKMAERLATAAISTLTGITTPTQEAPMKAPKTELKAPVRLGKTEPTVKDKAPLTNILTRHNSELSANDLWQRFGGEIDQFYAQLKTEVAQGWITEPFDKEDGETKPHHKMLEQEAD